MRPYNMTARDYERFAHSPYVFTHFSEVDISIFDWIQNFKCAGKTDRRYNDVIVMFDTETSKKDNGTPDNHICAWTISFACHNIPFLTAWGRKPSEFIEFMNKVRARLPEGDIYCYAHNLPYDYVFLRKFMFKAWGNPKSQLNVKPHYPIRVDFENGIVLRDSLILAQRKLEKWADDLNVRHKKATGKWDYDKLRNQDEEYTPDELEYIEHDTLAGVECIGSLMATLNKHIYSMPFTATGIPREESRFIGFKNHAKEKFLKIAPPFDVQMELEAVFHGGFTHANRYFVGQVVDQQYLEDICDDTY